MERRQSGESGQVAGGSGPILGVRHERKCWLGDAGLFLATRTQSGFAPAEERSDEVSLPHSALVHGVPEGWLGIIRHREPMATCTRAL